MLEALAVRARGAVLALLALVLAACGSTSSAPEIGSDPNVVAAPPLPVYRLGPSDEIQITTFGQEDLSGEFQLDSEGNFSLPLVGEIRANGLTTRELEDRVETAMRDDQLLVDPQVSVEVLTFRPFFILGEVNTPGQYEYTNGLTAQTAVALGGGYTERALRGRFLLQRGGSRAEAVRVSGETPLAPGDIVTIEERFF